MSYIHETKDGRVYVRLGDFECAFKGGRDPEIIYKGDRVL